LSFKLRQMPDFLAVDAQALLEELIQLELEMLHQGVADEEAYERLYLAVFAGGDVTKFLYQEPPVVAAGILRLIREMGLFILADDNIALAHMQRHVYWQSALGVVPAQRRRPDGTPIYTTNRLQQIENRAAFAALVHRGGAITFAERLPSIGDLAAGQYAALRSETTAIFNSVVAEAGARNDGGSRTLRQLFATTMQLINRRALRPQDEDVLLTSQPMPSLVCAHWAYREARQVQRIRDANPAAHPNFMALKLSVPLWP
jgi:hypothetical protein